MIGFIRWSHWHGHDEVDTHYHMSSTMYITRKEAIDLEIKLDKRLPATNSNL
jgi:hypothetical protein